MLILADVYLRHTRGGVRIAIIIWFALIAFSPILTYQHHLVDIAGGLALGALCFLLFRNADLCSPDSKREPNNLRSPL